MTEEQAARLRRRAVQVANKNHWEQHADDFAQFVIERALHGRDTGELKYLLYDFLDQEGLYTLPSKRAMRPRRPPPNLRSPTNIPFKVKDGEEQCAHLFNVPIRNRRGMEGPFTPARELEQFPEARLTKHQRAVVVLHAIFGLTNQEIAFCYGVSESRISQMLDEIQKKNQTTHRP